MPIYEQIHEYEVVRNTHSTPAITQQLLPPQPSGDYQLTTCPAYVPSTATALSSETDGEYDIPRDGVSSMAKRNEGQYENVTTGDGATSIKGNGEEQYEAVGTDIKPVFHA